jgi:cation transport ATPase
LSDKAATDKKGEAPNAVFFRNSVPILREDYDHELKSICGFDGVMVVRLAAAGLLLLLGLLLPVPRTAGLLLLIASFLVAGFDILIGAAASLIHKRFFDETIFLSAAAIAAFLIGKSYEGAAVMLLFQLGELFLDYAIGRSRRSVCAQVSGSEYAGSFPCDEMPALPGESDADEKEGETSGKAKTGRTEALVYRLARFTAPVILALAVLLYAVLLLTTDMGYTDAARRALVFLVAAGPSALLISVPLTFFAGSGGLAAGGVKIRSFETMDALAAASAFVFDKDGTLITGKYRVTSAKSERMEAEMLLRIAAHAVAKSDRPIAESIRAAYDGSVSDSLIRDFAEYPDGVRISVVGIPILLGSREFLRGRGIETEDDGGGADLAVYMAVGGTYAGRLLMNETVREDAADAVRDLKEIGCGNIALLSSDSRALSERIAGALGISEPYAECSPGEKAEQLRNIRNRIGRGTLALMVSDDADLPVMAEADVTVAMEGHAAKSVAKAADVVILGDSPDKLAEAVLASRRARSVLLQSTLLILAVKMLVLALCALGYSTEMWFAVFADAAAALAVVLNSLRAAGFFPIKKGIEV